VQQDQRRLAARPEIPAGERFFETAQRLAQERHWA
jgi:hypothetical protein